MWRRQGEQYAACNIVEVDRYDGGLVVALDEISLDGRTVLYVLVRGGITVAIHRSDILELIVRPFAGVIGDAFILIQDNARAQTVLVSMTLFDFEGISVMNWLTMSPYLNPIEHTWGNHFRQIRQWSYHPENVQNLIDVLVQKLQSMPQKGIRFMQGRCQEYMDDRGGHISYWLKRLLTLICKFTMQSLHNVLANQ